LKTKYREINAELGKTGARLTAEQIGENLDISNVLGMCLNICATSTEVLMVFRPTED